MLALTTLTALLVIFGRTEASKLVEFTNSVVSLTVEAAQKLTLVVMFYQLTNSDRSTDSGFDSTKSRIFSLILVKIGLDITMWQFAGDVDLEIAPLRRQRYIPFEEESESDFFSKYRFSKAVFGELFDIIARSFIGKKNLTVSHCQVHVIAYIHSGVAME